MGRSLYEINKDIENCVSEDGEILDFEALDRLQTEKKDKIENVALWYKNVLAEASQLKQEAEAFTMRYKKKEKLAESLEKYLTNFLLNETEQGRFETVKVDLSFRRSYEVVPMDESLIPSEYFKIKPEEKVLDKMAVKQAWRNHLDVPGVSVQTNHNLQIK